MTENHNSHNYQEEVSIRPFEMYTFGLSFPLMLIFAEFEMVFQLF